MYIIIVLGGICMFKLIIGKERIWKICLDV